MFYMTVRSGRMQLLVLWTACAAGHPELRDLNYELQFQHPHVFREKKQHWRCSPHVRLLSWSRHLVLSWGKARLQIKTHLLLWLFSVFPLLPSGPSPSPPRGPVDAAHVAGVFADRLPAAPQASHPVPAEGVQDHSGGRVHRGARYPRPAPDV